MGLTSAEGQKLVF